MPRSRTVKFTSTAHNLKLPPERFEPPLGVKALIEEPYATNQPVSSLEFESRPLRKDSRRRRWIRPTARERR